MMRRAGYIALVAALALTGCGGSKHKKTIPRADAQALITELDQVSDNFDSKACNGARAKVGELETKANALPASVDQTVKQNILDGLARLDDLVGRDCRRAQTNTQTNTTPTETQTTTTQTTTTNTETNTPPTETNTTPTNTSTGPTTTPPGGATVPGNGTGGTSTGASDGKKKDGK
jgi:cell division septation protein DedD